MTQIVFHEYTVLNFVENWINKETRSDNLENKELIYEFNKFFSYFVAFNALYNEAYFQQTGKTVGIGEDKKAMKKVIGFLEAENLKNALTNKAERQINFIKSVIDNNIFRFHLHSRNNTTGEQLDVDCRNKLDNGTPTQYCEAVLLFLYQTRCNMFHGSKEFDYRQKELICSMSVILEVLIDCLKQKLSTRNLITSWRMVQ